MTLQKTFLVWLTALVTLLALLIIFIISRSNSAELKQQLDNESLKLAREITSLLTVTDNLMQSQVKSSMRLLNERLTKGNIINLGDDVTVAEKTVNDLMINGVGQANNFQLVDSVTEIMGGTATLFTRDGDDFVRISTNVINNGKRAIGTLLDPKGLAIAAIKKSQPFYGVVDILGNPFVTGYEPILDENNQVIGISYVGYRADLASLNSLVEKSRLLENGFVAITDRTGKVRVHSDNVAADTVSQILQSNNDAWHQYTSDFPAWGYKVHLFTSEAEKRGLVWQSLWRTILIIGLSGLSLIAVVSLITRKVIIQPLDAVNSSIADIVQGDGDLRARLDFKRSDEIGTVATGFDSLLARIQHTIASINDISLELNSSAQTMHGTSVDVLATTESQLKEITDITHAIEEMTATAQDVAQSALNAETSARSVTEATHKVSSVITSTVSNSKLQLSAIKESDDAISSLNKASLDITKVLEVISSIADQTNLLALNAAIEAARAGEQGRGFSVVADEVRSLASRTQASTGEIRQMIQGLELGVSSVSQINQSYKKTVFDNVKYAEEAEQALEIVKTAAEQITLQNATIASAAEQQSTVASHIQDKTRQVSQFAKTSATKAELAQKTSDMLRLGCDKLTQLLSGFKV
ncbi:MAG: methyl-accepting chemotaxis protein [Gammaproteobacteria bacterium]|nr:methyl-accepting chemotaxis protein [Gammaproteobacteria bacterium]